MTKIEIISRYQEKEQMSFPYWECKVLGQPKLKFIPRMGDTIVIQAQDWKVSEIEHNIDENSISVFVESSIRESRAVTVPKRFLTEEERIHFETCGK